MPRAPRPPRPIAGVPRGRGRAPATRPWAALLALLPAALACSSDVEVGSPLAIKIDGPSGGVAGEALGVRYDVVGRSLQGIVFSWGDGAVDSLATAGAQSASGTMYHTYEAAGDFLVGARVEDSVEGVAKAELAINIREGQETDS